MKKITYALLNLLFVLDIVCVVLLPFFHKEVNLYYNYTNKILTLFIAFVCFSGIIMACLLYNLKKLYKTFAENNPFTRENIKYLNRLVWCCFSIAVTYAVKCISVFSPASAVVVLLFGCCGLLIISLRDLFVKAVEYKEENDLTI